MNPKFFFNFALLKVILKSTFFVSDNIKNLQGKFSNSS